MIPKDDAPDAPAPSRRKQRAQRGYLLLEVMVGGVLAAAALGDLIIEIGAYGDRTSRAGRDVTAHLLAQQVLEQARATPIASLTAGTTTIAKPAQFKGKYTITRVVTAGTETGPSSTTITYRDVTVTVTFPQHSGTRTTTINARIYDES